MPKLACKTLPIPGIVNHEVNINTLNPHPRNFRSHPERQIENLITSYRRFGQFRSIVAVEDKPGAYLIVAGHGITEAMKRAGATTVRIDEIPKTTDEQTIEAILIADNLHAQESTDNEELLAMLLTEQKDAGFDLASLGSDDEALRQMLALADSAGVDHSETVHVSSSDDEEPEYNGTAKLRFEAGRAGGAFAVHDLRTWDDARIARFKQWKEHPDTRVDECELMAKEIAACIHALFGSVLPPLVLTVPPRGKTEGSTKPYAIGILAARVGALLGVDLVEMVQRSSADTQTERRSRWRNLRDSSEFVVSKQVETLTLVLDDVTTTGSTFERVRAALAEHGIPNILMAYVVWHTRLEAPNSA